MPDPTFSMQRSRSAEWCGPAQSKSICGLPTGPRPPGQSGLRLGHPSRGIGHRRHGLPYRREPHSPTGTALSPLPATELRGAAADRPLSGLLPPYPPPAAPDPPQLADVAAAGTLRGQDPADRRVAAGQRAGLGTGFLSLAGPQLRLRCQQRPLRTVGQDPPAGGGEQAPRRPVSDRGPLLRTGRTAATGPAGR